MSYHKILGFEKEPFSTSPDPDFLYLSKEHDMTLTNILIELRLRRGLMAVFGDIGTGKTTLSRKLIQELNRRGDMIFHMILNPSFTNEQQFLISFIKNFNIQVPHHIQLNRLDVIELRDIIEKFLITKTIEQKKTVVLVIDEAQKLDLGTLESLRLFLNFETNEFKMIQIVLFGQLELLAKLSLMPNFVDRISFRHILNPLSQRDTAAMIEFRMKKAGNNRSTRLFLEDAIQEIHSSTGGYPRRINMLCHQILKELVVQNQDIADRTVVREVANRQVPVNRLETIKDAWVPVRSPRQSLIG